MQLGGGQAGAGQGRQAGMQVGEGQGKGTAGSGCPKTALVARPVSHHYSLNLHGGQLLARGIGWGLLLPDDNSTPWPAPVMSHFAPTVSQSADYFMINEKQQLVLCSNVHLLFYVIQCAPPQCALQGYAPSGTGLTLPDIALAVPLVVTWAGLCILKVVAKGSSKA